MALRSRIGVFCNCGSGKSFTGSTVLATAVSSRDWKNFKSPNSSTMDTTHTMTRPMANLPTAQTLTSVVSCPIWGLRGCLVSSMFRSEEPEQQHDGHHAHDDQTDGKLAHRPDVDVRGFMPDLGIAGLLSLVHVPKPPPSAGHSAASAGASPVA